MEVVLTSGSFEAFITNSNGVLTMNPTGSDAGVYNYDIKIKDVLTSTEIAQSIKITVGEPQPPFLNPVPANKETFAFQQFSHKLSRRGPEPETVFYELKQSDGSAIP